MLAATPANDLPITPDYNICPTSDVSVIASDRGRRLISMRWGFVPLWYKTLASGPLLINARAETIAKKPAFRAACRTQRCLIPASGFYEWQTDSDGARLPWYIQRTDGEPVIFAGIWQVWDKGDTPINTCAIVTTTASRALSDIHHRMPVILTQDQWPLWLGEEGTGAAVLMQPAPVDALKAHRVATTVNSNSASGPELIAPL